MSHHADRDNIVGMHILLIEDDLRSAEYRVKGRYESGPVEDHAADGADGLHLALTTEYDVIVADRMLPQRDGLSIIRLLRADQNLTPVLVLSALGEVDDRVDGLRAGGDDSLVKPYAFSELLARLEALTRRNHLPQQAAPASDRRSVGRPAHTAGHARRQANTITTPGAPSVGIPHAPRGLMVTRTLLLEQVWDFHFDPLTNVINVQISRLRSKIDKDFGPSLLHTVRGAGYKLSESP